MLNERYKKADEKIARLKAEREDHLTRGKGIRRFLSALDGQPQSLEDWDEQAWNLAMVIDGIGRIIAWFSIREYAPRSGWVLASSIISLVFGLMLTTSPMLQMSVGVFVVLLTGWWILTLGIIRIVHAFHLLKIKRESPDFVFGEMIGSNWWVALILGLLLGVLGVIVILNPLLGLGVIGVVVGCGMITAGINLIFLSTSVWLL